MNALALVDDEFEWKVVRSGSRGKCAYQNVLGSAVSFVDFTQNGKPLPEGFGRLDDLLDELESDPDIKDDLASARKEIAATQIEAGNCSLGTLRMAKGLSQTELAEMLGTSQAAVSRLESGEQEPRLSTLRRLSHVLGVDLNTLNAALPA